MRESIPAFADVAERLTASAAQSTDSSHNFAPTRSLTSFTLWRRISGKIFLTYSCAASRAFLVLARALSSGPFFRGVYGAVNLAVDPETITVLGKCPVHVFRTVIRPERVRNPHVRHEELYDGKNGRRALVPISARSLEAGGAVHEHDKIPGAPE